MKQMKKMRKISDELFEGSMIDVLTNDGKMRKTIREHEMKFPVERYYEPSIELQIIRDDLDEPL